MPDLPQGIIDSLLHPPLQLLAPNLDTRGPFSGDVWLADTSSHIPAWDTFGIVVQAVEIPPSLGLIRGYNGTDSGSDLSLDWFYDTLCQVGVWYRLFSGAPVAPRVDDMHYGLYVNAWSVAAPMGITLHTLPGVSVDLYWLKIG